MKKTNKKTVARKRERRGLWEAFSACSLLLAATSCSTGKNVDQQAAQQKPLQADMRRGDGTAIGVEDLAPLADPAIEQAFEELRTLHEIMSDSADVPSQDFITAQLRESWEGLWAARITFAVRWDEKTLRKAIYSSTLNGGSGPVTYELMIRRTLREGTPLTFSDQVKVCYAQTPPVTLDGKQYVTQVNTSIYEANRNSSLRIPSTLDEDHFLMTHTPPFSLELGLRLPRDQRLDMSWPHWKDLHANYHADHDGDGHPGVTVMVEGDGSAEFPVRELFAAARLALKYDVSLVAPHVAEGPVEIVDVNGNYGFNIGFIGCLTQRKEPCEEFRINLFNDNIIYLPHDSMQPWITMHRINDLPDLSASFDTDHRCAAVHNYLQTVPQATH